MFRYLILGLLRDGEPQHGYALMKAYLERAGVRISSGNFYRELSRLVGEGLVRATRKPANTDPRRVPYEITDEGMVAFDTWLTAPNAPRATHYEDDLSARALFVAESGEAVVRQLLSRWQDELWVRVKALERLREVALTRRRQTPPPTFDPLTLLLARRIKHLAADLDFLDEFRTTHSTWSATARSPERQPRSAPVPGRAFRPRS